MITFEVFTLFPQVFEPYLETSILHRARENQIIDVHLHNIRDWSKDKHKMTDDLPYGGGGGMVMKPEPIFSSVEGILGTKPDCPIILLSPQGRPFNQKLAIELASPNQGDSVRERRIAFICGRYEGVDERVRQHLVTDEISIGDYVITGGELAALVIIDAVTRLLPGVLGDPCGAFDDSYASGLLEYPHYTRPAVFRDWSVPEVLLSGDHARIDRWRREQSIKRTLLRRPDMLNNAPLTENDKGFLSSLVDNPDQSS